MHKYSKFQFSSLKIINLSKQKKLLLIKQNFLFKIQIKQIQICKLNIHYINFLY